MGWCAFGVICCVSKFDVLYYGMHMLYSFGLVGVEKGQLANVYVIWS